jgi:hypothetical protein
MQKTLAGALFALLTACGGAIAPSPGNGQDPSGDKPGPANPGSGNPGVTNPGANPNGDPGQPGDTSSGSATITGTVDGAPFTYSSVIAMEETEPSTKTSFLFLVLSNRAFTCSQLQDATTRNETFANMEALMVGVYTNPGGSLLTGSFDIAGTASTQAVQGMAAIDTTNATCGPTTNEATSGTVTIGTLLATQVSGSFVADFSNGDQLEGTFAAPLCNLGVVDSGSMGSFVCVQ